MRSRTILNSGKEGLLGIFRHPLVMVASVTTILLMLLIISTFTIFSANVRFIMDNVKKQPPIEVSLKIGVTQEEADPILEYLDNNLNTLIYDYSMESPEQTFEYFRSELGEKSKILEGFDYNSYLPYKIRIQLVDPSTADEVVMRVSAFPGAGKIQREEDVMRALETWTRYVNVGSVIAFVVLLIVSVFVISNMVRMSVYARSEEISIMKYVGANSFYIRLPYVMEGVITGLISAICAWGLAHIAYDRLLEAIPSARGSGTFVLLPVNALSGAILLVCILTGVLIGAFGSGVSVRKYVQV